MAINFSGGQQNAPAALIQVQAWHLNTIHSSNSTQSAWYDFLGASNNYGITLKRANSTIILHQSLNMDINGGSTGHFLRWLYRIGTGGSWTSFNNAVNTGSNRRIIHHGMDGDQSNDMRHRAHRQILTTSSAAGTTFFFKLQSYLIPGAAYIKINHANNDNDTTSNARGSSYIFLEEYSNPT